MGIQIGVLHLFTEKDVKSFNAFKKKKKRQKRAENEPEMCKTALILTGHSWVVIKKFKNKKNIINMDSLCSFYVHFAVRF